MFVGANSVGMDEHDHRLKDAMDFINFPTVEDLERAQRRSVLQIDGGGLLFEEHAAYCRYGTKINPCRIYH